MSKIIMLGTGYGVAMDLFNTCFFIQNSTGGLLVDTGGGIELIKKLEQANIDYKSLEHIFISHSHADHVLGAIWLFKKLGTDIARSNTDKKINLYCNDIVFDTINNISKYVLPARIVDTIGNMVNFVILEDGDTYNINGVDYTFLDMHAKGTKLFGFICKLNGKRFAFLGDETLSPELYQTIEGSDYVMHEAFCLDSEVDILFRTHGGHQSPLRHSTAKSVGKIMNNLRVKNLILYHTEESHQGKRKELYTNEAKTHFGGNVIVPNDLETIEIK